MLSLRFPWAILLLITIAADVIAVQSQEQSITAEAAEFFERDVRPLLLENCIGCHSQSVNKVKGGLNMDSRQSLIEGGDSGAGIDLQSPDKSLILEAVRRQSIEMPPDKSLSTQQIAILEKWLKLGAPWPEHASAATTGRNWIADRAAQHWAWKPVQSVSLPVANVGLSNTNDLSVTVPWSDSNRPSTVIDALVQKKLHELKIEPSGPAKRYDLIRRLYFDLIGLPPTPEQLQHALAEPNEDRLIDQLLASPQFGARWGRHWLDLMRYAETLGHEFDYPIRHAWRYREAVVNAFNDDLRYDQLVADHLAGDLQANPRIHALTGVNESLASTGWWWMGDSVHAPVDVKNDWATRTENQVDVFSKAFLGMTVACARCHDHKFDPIGVSDYYGLVGVARSTRRQFAITDPHGRIVDHLRRINEKLAVAQPQAIRAWQSVQPIDVERWLEKTISQWRMLPPDQLQQQVPLESPLFPLRLLVEQLPIENAEAKFAERLAHYRQEVNRAQSAYTKWQSESQLFAQFDDSLPSGWRFDSIGNQIHSSSEARLVDWFDGPIPLPAKPNSFSSGRLGRSQYSTLRSPNFELTRRCVCIKMRGKSTQSMVCVDGYFMTEVQGLLFADLRKPIDQPSDEGWVIHSGDLRKYIGDPTFLSFESESGAWFQISQIWLADQAPPTAPHAVAVAILDSPAENQDAFRANLIERIASAVKDSATRSTITAEQIDFARAVLRVNADQLIGPAYQDLADQAQSLQQLAKRTPTPTILIAAEEGDPSDAAVEIRGNPHQVGELTPRGCFQTLVPWRDPESDSSGRKELVESLTNQQHPLVARVMANRVWHHLMGRGLVASTDNFGVLGSRPTHPELLDYLAQQFIENDWSIKWLVRHIVTSDVYRRSSTPLAEHAIHDADGSLYSHRTVRRLDAEVLRDTMLLTCGSLDNQLTGPSVPVYLTEQMTGRGRPGVTGPLDGNNRRSVFIEVRRNFLNQFLLAFDFPMPSTTTGKRNVSNVPAQALGLLNDPLVEELSKRWVSHTASISDARRRAEIMMTFAFSRPISSTEIDRCVEFISQAGDSGWQDLAHTLLNAKEFWYVR